MTIAPNYAASCIAVDCCGNVYTAGTWNPTGINFDFILVKRDPAGNVLWTMTFNSSGTCTDSLVALALDGWGNVYLTGAGCGGVGTDWDYVTVKFSAGGEQLWVRSYAGIPVAKRDWPAAIVVDADGNVYVTGESWGGATREDFATVKYDTDGNQLWAARYDGPIHEQDAATALFVDAGGNVYVTGQSDEAIGNPKQWGCATLKLSAAGEQLWVIRSDGPLSDVPADIAVDGAGSVFIAVQSTLPSSSSRDFLMIKYVPTP